MTVVGAVSAPRLGIGRPRLLSEQQSGPRQAKCFTLSLIPRQASAQLVARDPLPSNAGPPDRAIFADTGVVVLSGRLSQRRRSFDSGSAPPIGMPKRNHNLTEFAVCLSAP